MSTLDGEKLDSAVSYNNRQGLDSATIERVQQIVGTKVDGKLGPSTARAVFKWQGTVSLVQDGKLGPKTLAAIARAKPDDVQLQIGVWVDDSAKVVLSERYFDNLESLGLSTLAIMVHRSTAGSETSWRPRWTVEQLERARLLAEPRKMALVLTTWPLPNRELLSSFARELPPLMAAAGAVGLEVDTEGNWLESRLDGYADMDEAARALLDMLREVATPSRARLELTTYPFHPENGAQAKIAPHMNLLFPQAYSVANRQNKQVDWDDREGPGRLQTFSAARARSISQVATGETKLGMGLPAYDQDFIGHSANEALTLAFNSARKEGVVEVRYWSSKWILGHMRNDSAAGQFLLARANGTVARAALPKRLVPDSSDDAELARIAGDDELHQTRELEDMRAGMVRTPAVTPSVESSVPPSVEVSCPESSSVPE
jgi:hypothetical protein